MYLTIIVYKVKICFYVTFLRLFTVKLACIVISLYLCIQDLYCMNIKDKLKGTGWTISSLAAKMKNKQGGYGISQQSMSQIINGNPTISKLQEIADIIGISLSELVSDNHPSDFTALIKKGDSLYSASSIEQLEALISKLKG